MREAAALQGIDFHAARWPKSNALIMELIGNSIAQNPLSVLLAAVLSALGVHGAIISGRRAAAHVRAAMRGADALAGGEDFEAEYRARLFRKIYNEDNEEEEEWDRNP